MDVCKSLGVTSQDDIDAIYDYVFEEYSKLWLIHNKKMTYLQVIFFIIHFIHKHKF
jgi:hypothetical protein